ncbi:ribosomal protein S18-alanine N-acetyltransferase [Bartonella sp. B10]
MAKFLLREKNFRISPLKTSDSSLLHQIHQQCFIFSWDKQAFDDFLKDPYIFGYKAYFTGKHDQILGFCLCRLILDEAEIITITVHPHFRRQGIGSLLINSTFRHLHNERAVKLFLEVEEANLSALRLYKRFEFQKISKRPAYYQSQNGYIDAIVMQKTFEQID